jgi:CheY-like chemotaxis protein
VGAEVVIAENGKIGVEKALVEPFDIIVMDIQMPVLDGLRATQELRLKGMNIPIIALTAHVLRSELDRCMQAGCSAYLSKPVTVPLLLSAIRSALSEGKKPPQTPIVGLPQPEDSDASAAGEVRPESLHAQS